jgi:hypothetical protein
MLNWNIRSLKSWNIKKRGSFEGGSIKIYEIRKD